MIKGAIASFIALEGDSFSFSTFTGNADHFTILSKKRSPDFGDRILTFS